MLRNSVINIILKVGLSISLLYAAVAALVVPAEVTSRWPLFVTHRVDEGTLASFTGIVCVALIIWLFFGSRKFVSALPTLICIALTGLFNVASVGGVSFIFSLAPLFFIALALCFRYYPRIRIVSETYVTPLHEGHLRGEKEAEVIDGTNSVGTAQREQQPKHAPHPPRPAR